MLLNNLSSTMQRICKSLQTVSETEIENVSATAPMCEKTNGSCLPTGNSESSSHDDQPITESAFQDLSLGDKQGDREPDKVLRYHEYIILSSHSNLLIEICNFLDT